MRIHFIAIGGAAMHSLAIALKQKGDIITGSDDEIVDPARSQLDKHGLLPSGTGWFPERIHAALDAVILGMHARKDNPELLRAQKLGVKVFSYPEFLYHETRGKIRVVIAGSHGKTTITSMVMHALKRLGYQFDYMVGSRLAGFENMVKLDRNNTIAVFEGDEYLSSCIDPRPKFLLYNPHIALISGIAWDHMNVFPTREIYANQFVEFIKAIPADGCLVYCGADASLQRLVNDNPHPRLVPYDVPAYAIEGGVTMLEHEGRVPLKIFGKHNMLNLMGAKCVCNQLGIADKQFYGAMTDFTGAGKRLQLLGKKRQTAVYLDFAHSPSKVEATIQAVKEQYPGQRLIACLELHTFSSLNRGFLGEYRHTMEDADTAVVYYNPETIRHKKLEMFPEEEVRQAFDKKGLLVFTGRESLEQFLLTQGWENAVLLLMSSGTFSGMNVNQMTEKIISG